MPFNRPYAFVKQPLVACALLFVGLAIVTSVMNDTSDIPASVRRAFTAFDSDFNAFGECMDGPMPLCYCYADARAMARTGQHLLDVARAERSQIPNETMARIDSLRSMIDTAGTVEPC